MQIWAGMDEKPLPFIFPIVLYHGKQKWTSDTNFGSLVHIPDGLERFVPRFDYYLYDLSQYQENEIKGSILSRVSLLLFKHIFDDNFGESFIRICELIKELGGKKTALEYMQCMLEYIGSTTGKITKEQVREGVKKALPLDEKGELQMPTLFEQFKEEGLLEGLEKGLEKGRKEGLKEAIELALELEYGGVGLSLYPQVQRIQSIDTLRDIMQRLREGSSLAELSAFLNTL